MLTPIVAALLVLPLADPTPEPEDVVAGWGAFGLFGLGILVVALLGWSLTKHLRKVDQAAAEGKYDPSTPRRGRGAPPPSSGTSA